MHFFDNLMSKYISPGDYFRNNPPKSISGSFNSRLPHEFTFVTGYGESDISQLNSFDNALLEAKIGAYNLLKYSSIIPASATFSTSFLSKLPAGIQTSIILAVFTGSKDQEIESGIALAKLQDYFVVFEHGAQMGSIDISVTLNTMLQEALHKRGEKMNDYLIVSRSEKVQLKYGTVVTAIVFNPLNYL